MTNANEILNRHTANLINGGVTQNLHLRAIKVWAECVMCVWLQVVKADWQGDTTPSIVSGRDLP